MTSKLYSIELVGMEACLVEIEVDKLGGIPHFTIVGLPDAAVKEASERVRSAIKNSDLPFPRSKIVVNLAPADLRKVGPRYDLAIAMGILAIEEEVEPDLLKEIIMTGELALDGKVRPVTGILSSVDFARKTGFKRMMVPADNAHEAALIQGIEILPVRTLREAVLYVKNELRALPINSKEQNSCRISEVDMSMVRGQREAKRALEIAAAGGHNLLMSGPPGAGKTLLARALAGILPSMGQEEMLEVTKIYSIAGLIPKSQPLITARPFRSVHHTASAISIVGGGAMPAPGEISLSHQGVLFMDEIAEFPQHVLDVLRQPLESRSITVSRARGSFTYPAEFTLVAAMNPCPCGYFNTGQRSKSCGCTNHQIRQYQKRLSGPLLDRIDLHLDVQPVEHQQLTEAEETENSEMVRQRVEKATRVQRERFKEFRFKKNASMDNRATEKFCKLDKEGKRILEVAVQKMGFSARAYFRILKLARTSADLEGVADIKEKHVAEALHFKNKI